MSKFTSKRLAAMVPYVPGEQPRERKYIKLNTNESPFPPREAVTEAAKAAAGTCHLYCDPEVTALTAALAERYGVQPENVLITNGSDEILNFFFMAFCDEESGVSYPDISYGFYSVFAGLYHLPAKEIPLDDELRIRVEDWLDRDTNLVFANPNAPTGRYLPPAEVERIVATNRNRIVVVDEAYIDFGGETVAPLIKKYDNLLVTGTFSKSRALAGGRVGFGIADAAMIGELKQIKYSTNPYNVNSVSAAMALAALREDEVYMDRCHTVMENRAYTTKALEALGFAVIPSMANFVFAKSERIGGEALYLALKERGILVRHFKNPRIKDYNRITIGTREQMDALLEAVNEILKEV
ncbi:MAG: histidinol-phosphate transaminase [Clostridia bacterium]|nr:histidinol-phosphate transaminase [Clostridia bacterium]